MVGEQERLDMIELIRERLVELLHTKEGSRVAMHCVWHGSAKVMRVCVCVHAYVRACICACVGVT